MKRVAQSCLMYVIVILMFQSNNLFELQDITSAPNDSKMALNATGQMYPIHVYVLIVSLSPHFQ